MQGSFIGFNTAGIKQGDNFLALVLKTKQPNQECQTFYLQAQVLNDLLLVLQYRMTIVHRRLAEKGESYKDELVAYNKEFMTNIPTVEMSEIQSPNTDRCIMSITLKPGDTWSTLIMVLKNEQISVLRIDDMQVEALVIGIQQALKNINDLQFIEFLNANLGFMMLYSVDLTKHQEIDYQQFPQDEWKLNLFSHYLGILYCYETDTGKKITSGAVIRTSAPHLSETEKKIIMNISARGGMLKAIPANTVPCQTFSKIIPAEPGKVLTLEECLRPLHAYFREIQPTLNS